MDEISEFLNALSATATTTRIDIGAGIGAGEADLSVRYRFGEESVGDGLPLLLSLTDSPLLISRVRASHARIADAFSQEDGEPIQPSPATRAVFVERDGSAGWGRAMVDFAFDFPAGADGVGRPLCVPEDLPALLSADRAEIVPLPTVAVSVDSPFGLLSLASDSSTGSESQQAADPRGPKIVLAAVVGRQERIHRIEVPAVAAGGGVHCTDAVLRESSEKQRVRLADFLLTAKIFLELGFGVRLATDLIMASEAEMISMPAAGSALVVRFEGFRSDENPVDRAWRITSWLFRLAKLWWGTGIRLSGRQGPRIESAIAMASVLGFSRSVGNLAGRGSNLAEVLTADGKDSRLPVARTDLAFVLAEQFGKDESLRKEFRTLTAGWWKSRVPAAWFLDWCVDHGVALPRDLTADSA